MTIMMNRYVDVFNRRKLISSGKALMMSSVPYIYIYIHILGLGKSSWRFFNAI